MKAYKDGYPLCVVCYEDANIMYDAQTMCKEHFELLFKDQFGVKKVTDKVNWGKSLAEMKGVK